MFSNIKDISKIKIKTIKSLASKKNRLAHQLYSIEGPTMVEEAIHLGIQIDTIIALDSWLDTHQRYIEKKERCTIYRATEKTLQQASHFKTANSVIALLPIPNIEPPEHIKKGLHLILDDIKNPGNLGTIIRIADWFNIDSIFCSRQSVDIYNPKVVQATMGSILRKTPFEIDIDDFLIKHKNIPIYGAVLNAKPIYELTMPEHAFILIGNEAKGINPKLKPFIDCMVSIPRFGNAESLNAAISTAILCSEFRRMT